MKVLEGILSRRKAAVRNRRARVDDAQLPEVSAAADPLGLVRFA
jgi:hypothetical protein